VDLVVALRQQQREMPKENCQEPEAQLVEAKEKTLKRRIQRKKTTLNNANTQ